MSSTTTTNNNTRTLLVIGLKPTSPASTPPGNPWNSDAIAAALSSQHKLAASRGWDMTVHIVDPDLSIASVEKAVLDEMGKKEHWDVVSIGYGVRGNLGLTAVFEGLVNVVVGEVMRRREEEMSAGVGKEKRVTRFSFATSPEKLVEGAERVMRE